MSCLSYGRFIELEQLKNGNKSKIVNSNVPISPLKTEKMSQNNTNQPIQINLSEEMTENKLNNQQKGSEQSGSSLFFSLPPSSSNNNSNDDIQDDNLLGENTSYFISPSSEK